MNWPVASSPDFRQRFDPPFSHPFFQIKKNYKSNVFRVNVLISCTSFQIKLSPFKFSHLFMDWWKQSCKNLPFFFAGFIQHQQQCYKTMSILFCYAVYCASCWQESQEEYSWKRKITNSFFDRGAPKLCSYLFIFSLTLLSRFLHFQICLSI